MLKTYIASLLFFIAFTNSIAQQQTIYFDYNSSELRQQSIAELDKISILEIDSILIIGHCDSRGDDQLNTTLSQKRAQSVADYLHKKNSRIKTSIAWKSFDQPTTTNQTEAGMQLNRRVELFYTLTKLHLDEEKKEPLAQKTPTTQPYIAVNHYKCQVVNNKGGFIPTGSYQLFDENNSLIRESTFENGKFNVVDSGKVSQLRVDGDNYFSQIISQQQIQEYCVVQLQEIKKKSYFTFRNLGFVPNDSTILLSSYPELEGLLKIMQENPTLKIHIEGHTNGVNTTQSTEWHALISGGRANAVNHYLLTNGIDKSRLSYKGYGCEKMVYPKAISQREAQANRRVEVKVISF